MILQILADVTPSCRPTRRPMGRSLTGPSWRYLVSPINFLLLCEEMQIAWGTKTSSIQREAMVVVVTFPLSFSVCYTQGGWEVWAARYGPSPTWRHCTSTTTTSPESRPTSPSCPTWSTWTCRPISSAACPPNWATWFLSGGAPRSHSCRLVAASLWTPRATNRCAKIRT